MSDPFAEDEFEIEFKEDIVAPTGVAEVQCVGVTRSTSKAGNDMIEWTFRLLGYIDKADADFNGKEWIVYTALTERAQWKVHETLVALGLRSDEDTKSKVTFKRDDALGVVCYAEITHDTYRGQPQATINALAPHAKEPGKKRKIETVAVAEGADPFAPMPDDDDKPKAETPF